MNQKCTCRPAPQGVPEARYEDPNCTLHGWREVARREGRNVELVALQRRLDGRAALDGRLGGGHE